jgi:fungal STAND N-terminal Goodbye domain
MSDQSRSSYSQVLFEAALQHYERQTGIALAKHPFAEQLQSCYSVESVTAVLREQTQAFGQFQETDKVKRLLKNIVSALHKLSAATDFGQAIDLVRV